MKKWQLRIATWGLVAFAIVNISGTVAFFVLQEKVRTARRQPSLTEGAVFPAFSGVDVQGVSWESGDVPCRIIRITDDNCEFCKTDKPFYGQVLDAARRASCELIELAPRAGGMAHDPRGGVVQLKFVDTDIGSLLFPFATPQTIIVDQDWRVRMTNRGVLNEMSVARAIALLREISVPLAPAN